MKSKAFMGMILNISICGFACLFFPSDGFAGQTVECKSTQLPEGLGSTLRFRIYEPEVLGSIALYYNDGIDDLLSKAWASYYSSKLQYNQHGQGVLYLTKGGGQSTVPRKLSLYLPIENSLRVGVFEQQYGPGGTFKNTETIYTYTCKQAN